MTYYPIENSYEVFTDLKGDPLENGYIYIGVKNLNPITNPLTVTFDPAGIYPAAQPIRTIAGYPSNNGTPANIYIDAADSQSYSILVQDKHGDQVFYSRDAMLTKYGNPGDVDNLVDLRAVSNFNFPVYVRGHSTVGDGGGGIFEWENGGAPGTYVDDNGAIIIPNGGDGSGAWIRQYNGYINVLWFGAKRDGVTDDAAAIQAAIDFANPDFNSGYGSTVFLPKAINNGTNAYLIGSTLEVPPAIILKGEGIFNATNVNGTHIKLSHDGVGIRFVRRNAGAVLFHNGGMENIAIDGTSGSSTTAQKLVELGDSSAVNTSNGAWNGFIRHCLFINTRGYGIYSAHSQEWLIDHCFFIECNRAINYSTVPASSRILNNTFVNQSATVCDYAINYEQGTLGGAYGFLCKNNYFIGFEYGIYIAGCRAAVIADNILEGTHKYCIYMSNTTFTGTNLGTTEDDLPVVNMHGNGFINAGSDGSGTYAVVFDNARFCRFTGNFNQSPNAALVAVLHLSESSGGLCSGNFIQLPTHQGSNSGTVPIYVQSNALWEAQHIQDQYFLKLRNGTGNPTLGATGDGAFSVLNGRVQTYLPNESWYKVATYGEKILPAGTTTTSVMGVTSVIDQNDAIDILGSFSDGIDGQIVTIHATAANTQVNVTTILTVIPIYNSLTVQYSGFYSLWREISRTF